MDGDEEGHPALSLERKLFDEAYCFEFFQAVRLLERHYKNREPVGRQLDRQGVGIKPSREVVRFRTRATLEFPASDIHEIIEDKQSDYESPRPPEMYVSFMGLTGPSGVLPKYVTEEFVAAAARRGEKALWGFLDIFNHRLISLFYRAWERYRFHLAFERRAYDELTEYFFDLVGLGTDGLRRRMELPDEGLLFYAGLVAQRPHSASALENFIGDYLALPARVEPFKGQWIELDEENVYPLGSPDSALGVNTIAGDRVWDSQSKFRVVLGPLMLEQFKRLLPSGSSVPAGADYLTAMEITRLMVGPGLDFDVQLLLKAEEVPDCEADSVVGGLLGWTTWLKTRPFAADDSQVVLPAVV